MNNNWPNDTIFSVSELNKLIQLHLEARFSSIQVQGEASGVTLASSGHLYFTLKDAGAAMRIVMFKGNLARSSIRGLENGQKIVVSGSLSMYCPRGEVQIIATAMKLQGLGDIFQALEKLKSAYAAKGYFAPERKRKLPMLPKRIGIVTSPTGAAIQDIIRILQRRFSGIELLLFPVKVQGAGAAQEIAAAIEYFNGASDYAVDVLIVGRGGGSIEDLWAFNEATVIEAIYHSRIPVISAVGHEIDFTISDFVADVRAATPSAAAELVVQRKDEWLDRVEARAQVARRLFESRFASCQSALMRFQSQPAYAGYLGNQYRRMQHMDRLEMDAVQLFRDRLERYAMRLNYWRDAMRSLDMRGRLLHMEARFDSTLARMHSTFYAITTRIGECWHVLDTQLAFLNPQAILARGYAIAWGADQRPVRDAAMLHAGDILTIRFAQGETRATVMEEE